MTNSPTRFGPYDVTLLYDGVFEASSDVLTHGHGEAARQKAIAVWNAPTLRIDVNCYVLRGGDGVTLIDAGGGPLMGPGFGQIRTALKAAGIAPEEVRRVLLTHIHSDHALGLLDPGLLDGQEAYFPQADVLVPETDFAFFTDPSAFEATPPARRGGFAIAKQLQKTYGDTIIKIPDGPVLPGLNVLPGIEALPLPGHTPGHTGYLLRGERDTDSLLLWGDVLHLATLQPGDPDIGIIYDLDPATAARTRRATLEQAARHGWTVAGGHTGFGRVERHGEAFRIVPA
jgi:glyoxylase-like metal-dependent hydrolase (beta-lactamase superfamily II)